MVVNGGGSQQQQPTPAPPPPPDVNNIMGGIEQTVGVRMHNHRRKLRQRFDLVRKLGQGTYGKVQLGINKETGQEVAIKTIKKAKIETEADLIRIRREIQIMSSVRHPNIIHIYEVFENKEKMVLVMEYAAGGELYDYLSQRKVLNEAEARRVFRQVASAVYYCHKHNICHRDLKLENILLDESKTAKIADFGLSNVFDDRRLLTTFCGSPLYASPEIVRGTPYHGPEVDCWSLGVLLYTLVYGAMPFDGSNFKRLVKQISSGEYYEPPDKPSTASPLVRHMLLVDPAKRANVEDICSHWWVNEGYGESCLEVAEELANQTPVRLDLLLSLVPPPESTDTVVVSAKTDQPASTASKEGDSMNEYYSAAEPSTSDAAKSGGVKKKKESSGQSGKEADKASTVKRRRAETDQVKSADDSTTMTPEGRGGCPGAGDLDAQNSAGPSPIDDSGIQTSLREEEEEELVTGVVQSAPEEVRTKSTSSEAKTKCDVMTDVDMDEGISTSSQADDRRSSVPIASCLAANPASAALAPCTIMTNNNNPSQSSSPSANATTTTSTTSTSSIPHCSSVSQHSPATSAFRQTTTTTTVTVGDVTTLSPPIAPTTANAEIEISRPPPLLDGRPTCAPAAAPAQVPESPESLVVASTGQPESHAAMAGKMDAKGAVPAANVVTEPPEPENTVALISPTNTTPPPPPPPSLNQVPPPPPPSTLGPEKTESAGDRSGATTAGSTATATPPPKEGAAPSGSGSNRSESSAANAPPASVALANRRPANTNKAAGPANAAEQRHSKILRQAEIFNSLVLTHSRNEPSSTTGPKSTMTLERPKKVTIFSYKLNDTRRPTETRTEPKVPTIVPVLKVSDAKRAFENNAAAAQQQRNSSIGSAASGHHHNSLPRRTLIQTPASVSTDAMVPKSLNQQRAGHAASMATMTATTTSAQESTNSSQGVEPGEKVVVGGLGVKIGAIGKVTEIGMKVKTEENNHQSENQTTPKDTKTSQPVQNDESLKPQQGSSSEKKLPEQSNAEQEVQVAVAKSEVASPVPVKEVQPSTKVSTKKVKESESPPSALPAQEPEEPKVREIPVMLDTGELETKVASIVAAPGRSPPKDPPAPRPTSLPTPVSSSTPSPKATGQVSSSATERMTSPPPKPIRVASPPPLRIASPPPRPVRIASPSPPAVAHKIINASARTVSPPPPLIRPSADQSPNQRPLSPSTLPSSRPMSPVYASSMTSTDRTDDDCIAGSENAFIRGIRSPTREHPAPAIAIPPLNKRFSKGPGDMPENAMVMVEAKPIQKAEINIAVNVASTSTNPRERIIPIRVEGRGEQVAAVAAVGGLVASESSKAVPKSLNSISVQLRATPPRVASPPPPAQPIKPVPIRPSSASRHESIQNPGPAMAIAESVSSESKKFLREPVRESAREPIRKSPREFIIPITVEGVSASHPAAAETASSSSASMRTSRFDRTKRYGSLYHEGETDFDISQTSGDVDNHAASPLHHLQRLSSFKKSHDEPETSRGRRGSDSSIDDDIDDDDDTFQILTAESLFSTLLSRVRQLTKRNQRAESNAADPFVVFRNSSRFTSPAPSAGGRSRATDVSDIHREFEDASSQMSTPGCTSPNAHHHNNNNRNSTGSDLLAGSASNKGFWNNVYSRASSVASESDARRYSTLDPPRFHPTETPQLQPPPSSAGVPSGLPWRRDTSVEGESNCSIASASMSQRGTAYHSPSAVNGDVNNATPASSRPFTSSLTRRKLNQHLRETNPELVGSPGQNGNHQQNNSDAMSDTSSTSAGNRSSLSWALSRFTGGVADSAKPTGRSVRDQQQQQPQYNRAKSSRELGNEPQQRTYQRYGRSSTLDNLDPDSSTAPSSASTTGYFHRIGSPFSDDENPNSGVSTPASYRTYTRTRSREYMSPTSSRGTSPVPSSSIAALPSISTTMSSPDAVANMAMNPIVPQLSTVLENGPLGVEGESSPRPTRAAESKLAAITSLNSTNPIPVSVPAPAPISAPNPPAAPTSENADGTIERKSRRVSRFLRPDFYDAPKEESSTEKQRFLKSVEQRWEKYNPDAGLMALSKTTNNSAAGSIQTIERPAAPISKDRATGSLTSTPPSPLQPILKARQSLTPIPAPAQPNLSLPPPSSSVVLKSVPEQPQVEPATNKIPQQVMLKPVPVEPQQQQQQQQSAPKSNGNAPSSKNSPKLTVRRQFEHLINLAAAQFQRSSSPNKVAPAAPAQTPASTSTTITPPTPVVSTATVAQPPTTIQQPSDTISLELKQLEDEIKNTAAIKAQASARLDALKYEHAVRSGAAAIPPSGIPKPAIPVKPIYLVARPVQEIPSVSPDLPIVPPEFQPFQYKGSNGTLRELSHRSNNNNRRDALSPPPAGANENGTISPFADEAVRFARIIKRFESQPYENSWASDAMGIDNAAPGTPTDSYESSSVCSDLRGDQRDSGEDESVSERIFRKSFYSRFNEPTKTKHRRSMTRELDGGEGGEGNLPITDAQPPISRRSSQHRKSLSGRDESVDRIGLSETVMVRKFLSSGDANGGGNFDRERRLSASRRHPSVSEYSDATVDVIHPRRSMSREVSVARSVKSDTQPPQVTSPTPSVAGSDSGDRAGPAGREVRSYARTYSSSRALANDLPPSGNGESYSSASLGRRSYYPTVSSTSTNADHISSLPRRSSNRYSIHEHVPESTNVRLRSTGSSVLASRPSRYSSILLEESGGSGSAATGHQISNVLSPNSTRRHTNLSDSGLTRRESTFYGTPSPFSSRPGAGSGAGGSTTGSTSTYFLRSTSSGLDHHNNNSTNHSGTYSTLRPSLLRHRR